MNKLPAGYTRRPDGTYAKTVTFTAPRANGVIERGGTETLVRSPSGRLLRVERGKRVERQRACARGV